MQAQIHFRKNLIIPFNNKKDKTVANSLSDKGRVFKRVRFSANRTQNNLLWFLFIMYKYLFFIVKQNV